MICYYPYLSIYKSASPRRSDIKIHKNAYGMFTPTIFCHLQNFYRQTTLLPREESQSCRQRTTLPTNTSSRDSSSVGTKVAPFDQTRPIYSCEPICLCENLQVTRTHRKSNLGIATFKWRSLRIWRQQDPP